MLLLVEENVGNFLKMQGSKRFSRIAWAAIPTSSSFGFLRPSSKVWQFSPRFFFFQIGIWAEIPYNSSLMNRFILHFLTFLFIGSLAVTAYSQNSIPVQGKEYEGNIQGMASLTINFKADGNAVFTMSVFGNKESKNVTYEQSGNQIIVHAQNGDMTFTQSDTNVLSTNMNGISIQLTCQTPEDNIVKIENVANHVFSGNFGNNGKLTLSFLENGFVSVSVFTNNKKQEETWPYTQNGDTIVLTEPMGRNITLHLNENNNLKGLFTIINVTLTLIR